MRGLVAFLESPTKISPVAALLLTLGMFVLSSLVFNLIVWFAFLVGLQRLLGGLLQGLALFAMFAFALPIAAAAAKSSAHERVIIVTAGILLTSAYLAGLQWDFSFVTDWLFPHWPGMPSGLSTSRAAFVVLLAFMLFGLAYWTAPDISKKTNGKSDDADTLTELGEGAAEGLSHQFGRHSRSGSSADAGDFDGLV